MANGIKNSNAVGLGYSFLEIYFISTLMFNKGYIILFRSIVAVLLALHVPLLTLSETPYLCRVSNEWTFIIIEHEQRGGEEGIQ